MTTILVPLDGSPLAERALPYARLFAATLGARVLLLHVVPPRVRQSLLLLNDPLSVGDPDAPLAVRERHLHEWLHHEATAYLSPHAQALRAADLEVAVVIEDGDPAERIVGCAGDAAPHLIVMASHGYSGLTRWELGSVADRVVQATETPVLLVQSGVEQAAPPVLRQVLVPLDGSPLAAQALPLAARIARNAEAELVLLRVVEPLTVAYPGLGAALSMPQLYDQLLRDSVTNAKHMLAEVAEQVRDEEGVVVRTLVQQGMVAETIVAAATGLEADLVVMATHGYGGLRRWALGSISDKVLHATSVPVLLVPVHHRLEQRVSQEG